MVNNTSIVYERYSIHFCEILNSLYFFDLAPDFEIKIFLSTCCFTFFCADPPNCQREEDAHQSLPRKHRIPWQPVFAVRHEFWSIRRFTEGAGPSEREPPRRIAERKFVETWITDYCLMALSHCASTPTSKFNISRLQNTQPELLTNKNAFQ